VLHGGPDSPHSEGNGDSMQPSPNYFGVLFLFCFWLSVAVHLIICNDLLSTHSTNTATNVEGSICRTKLKAGFTDRGPTDGSRTSQDTGGT